MKKNRSGIIQWFTYNPVAANLLMFAIIIAGLVSLTSIKRSLNPDVDPLEINVVTAYPGAGPWQVEQSITVKIEEKIKDIEGIDRFYSSSTDSLSSINIDVNSDADILEVLERIQSQIEAIQSFPKDMERPVVSRRQPQNRAVMLQIYGDMNESGMKMLADEIKLELMQNTEIASVDILGTRPYEISVEIAPAMLQRHKLSISDIASAIKLSSVDIPGGNIKSDNGQLIVRASGQAYNNYEFENIILKSFPDSTHLLLGDIATIKDGFSEVDKYTRFNGKPSVSLAINAIGNQDVIKIARIASEYVKQKQQDLSADVNLVTWADITYYLDQRISMMNENLFMGALLVFTTLALLLDIRLAFWVMIGLPVCFLGAIAVMPVNPFNVSLNMVSLFGFLLVLGVVVDDAIIIAESVHHKVRQSGNSLNNVVEGVHAVAIPAIFGVLTTIAAFAPTIFVSGTFAAVPQAIGYVVIFCLIFSLIESKWILPAHLAHISDKENRLTRWTKPIQKNVDGKIQHFIQRQYLPFLHMVLKNRYTSLSVFISALILTAGLISSGLVRLAIIPDIPSDFLIAKIEMIDDSSERQLRDALTLIENSLLTIESENIVASKQQALLQHRLVVNKGGQTGLIMVELVKSDERNLSSVELAERWRKSIGAIAGVKALTFSSVEDAAAPPLAFKIIGTDTEKLFKAAQALENKLATYHEVFDIENGSADINNEVHLTLKPSARRLGLSMSDLGTQVRNAFHGAEAQRIQRGNDEIKVMVRYPPEQRSQLANLENMFIFTQDANAVPFSAVADLRLERGFAQRTRINGEQAVTVIARVDKGKTQPSIISKNIIEHYGPELENQYPGIRIKLDGAAVEEEQMIRKIFYSLIAALIAIYILLAIPLRSYAQPLLIMFVIPFGMIGSIFGHLVMNMSVNMLSFFGMIALAGVVVNDSLVLVDFINRAITQQHLRVEQAITDAVSKRFRAIFITSMTTFAGLIPMLFETSLQAQLVIPMAVSLAYGIVFATTITLLLIPCLFLILDDLKNITQRLTTARPVLKSQEL